MGAGASAGGEGKGEVLDQTGWQLPRVVEPEVVAMTVRALGKTLFTVRDLRRRERAGGEALWLEEAERGLRCLEARAGGEGEGEPMGEQGEAGLGRSGRGTQGAEEEEREAGECEGALHR